MTNSKPVEVIFFDMRDTLGEVDRPGHLLPYQPSTDKLLSAVKDVVGLRIGIITNLPTDISADQGRAMLEEAGIAKYLDPDGLVINHEAGYDKPDPEIYRFAARQMGVDVEQCIFSGENLIEVLGAKAAGMKTQLKPCPPGREFLPPPVERREPTATDSGRAFEAFFEHEHLLGERIFACGSKIVESLKQLADGAAIPPEVKTSMRFFVYLLDNFADQVHLRAEEATIPIAVARGMDPIHGKWVFNQHDQARAYFKCLDVAWHRIETGDERDAWYAVGDFWRCTEAFVTLFEHHAIRENDELYVTVGKYFNDTDDSMVFNIIKQYGWQDVTPYVAMVESMERSLGIPSPA